MKTRNRKNALDNNGHTHTALYIFREIFLSNTIYIYLCKKQTPESRKVKLIPSQANINVKNNAELAQLVEQLIRPMINKEGWGKVKSESGKVKFIPSQANINVKNNAELAQLVEQLIRPMINKEGWGR